MHTDRRVKPGLAACFLLWLTAAPATALDREALTEALSSSNRELSDRIRDEYRKPVEVLDFLGIEPGMTLLDVYAAGGYYTVVLSHAAGPEGRVYAQNTPRGLRFEEDRMDRTQGEVLAQKIRDGGLDNVVRKDVAVSALDIEPGSLDGIMLALILHDYYNGSPSRARSLLERLYALLRPGGVLGVIDHVGRPDMDNRRLHRMLPGDAVAIAEEAGFVVESQSDLLRNPGDDYRRAVFDPLLNRNTDRFLLRLRKPGHDEL